MHFVLRNLNHKKDEISLFGGFIHDSVIEKVEWNKQDSVLNLSIQRPFYEEPKYKRFLLIFPVWQIRDVPCIVKISGVVEFNDTRRKRTDIGEPEQLLNIEFESENQLLIETDFGDIRILLNDNSSIDAIDIGEPSKKSRTKDLLRLIIPAKVIDEINKVNEI